MKKTIKFTDKPRPSGNSIIVIVPKQYFTNNILEIGKAYVFEIIDEVKK